MKKIIFIALLNIFTIALAAQEKDQHIINDTITPDRRTSKPEYPGGLKAFYDYISKNFKADKRSKGGKIIVSFFVETDGTLSNVRIVRGIDVPSNQNMIRVIERSEKWTPGYQDGKAVRAQFSLPITVNLN